MQTESTTPCCDLAWVCYQKFEDLWRSLPEPKKCLRWMLQGFARDLRERHLIDHNHSQDPDKGWDHLTRNNPQLECPLRMGLEGLQHELDEAARELKEAVGSADDWEATVLEWTKRISVVWCNCRPLAGNRTFSSYYALNSIAGSSDFSIRDEHGRDVEALFREYVLGAIRAECPEASQAHPEICQRLANVIVQRRMVWNYHRQRKGHSANEVVFGSAISPPSLAPDVQEFTCPVCFVELPREWSEPDQWRRHVARDLEIFICIYDTCTYDEKQREPQWFHSHREFDDWWLSMEPRHGRGAEWASGNWACSGHTREEAEESGREINLYALPRDRERKPLQIPAQCHLCGDTPDRQSTRLHDFHGYLWNPAHDRTERQMQLIFSHLAGHLEKLGSLAVTCNTDAATLGHLPELPARGSGGVR
ncbi:hypothetical protein BO78DRAFT_430846 [Aspergillus sclerotiicarbonarius CBS 121057]|uniref:C2H2-type domain-containing protein n=1 Tax=Aspergillus sclerotiicarbonarius (strain CBS 121057 / IBT 28362) TaxID=1448318 RepID=A0A319FET1_ASPSB|nr:hypothetical protein BO78DRAFT_430846 [Aspergillus sclerotiicarbonarius CBS 121057]